MNIRDRFPSIINNPDVIYFDSASTTQKPDIVIESMQNYYSNYCSNTGRGSYMWANKVTNEIKTIRKKTAKFINASSENEIVFTSGATDSLNTIVYSWALHNLKNDDEIILCPTDHKSSVLPWLHTKKLLNSMGVNIHIHTVNTTQVGEYNLKAILPKVSAKTKLINFTHIHNIYGADMNVESLHKEIGNEVLTSLDASQSVGHIELDVQKLGMDFVSFSGHKMFASTGIGVLWVNPRIHSQLNPFKVGGNTSDNIDWINKEIKCPPMPYLLESGTPNIAGIISLGKAIDFIEGVNVNNIHVQLAELTQYLLDKLKNCRLDIEFLPGMAHCTKCSGGYGIVSFRVNGFDSNDIGFLLSDSNIFVRTGNHCSSSGDPNENSIRVSMHIYNTKEEIDRFIDVLESILDM